MNLNLDIITNYFCSQNCQYCFLYSLRNDKQIVDINKLRIQLDDILAKYNIDNINLYGGEITLLPFDYIKQLIDLCQRYSNINIITNFTDVECNKYFEKNNINIGVSINSERQNIDIVETNLLIANNKDNISLIQVVTPLLIRKSSQEILNYLNSFRMNIGFLQYSPAINAKVNYIMSNREFSNFLRDLIIEYYNNKYNFQIYNIQQLDSVMGNTYDPTMRSILFINPYNQYCGVKYQDGFEYFQIFDNLKVWEDICQEEENKYYKKCGKCKYYKRCYTEHLRDWNTNDECCGMKSLLEWYEKDIYQNNRIVSTSM